MKTMILPALGLLFVTTACHTPYFPPTPSDEITVELRGTPGLTVCGNYYIDGVKQTLHGQIPMNIRAVASSFHCDFYKTSPGDLSLAISRNCKPIGQTVATSSKGGVRAELTEGDSFVMSSLGGY